jgi:CDP-paratose 2-epimerase
MLKILVTGSCGLIGSEAVHHYAQEGHEVMGFDNNMRRYFFGAKGDTSPMAYELTTRYKNYRHQEVDIRNRDEVAKRIKEFKPDYIVHTAAQPSHDWAAREPFTDFEVNALGTLNLLEAFRQHTPNAVFVFMSTNKVYGDAPNFLPMTETPKRYEYEGPLRGKGISESLSVDHCLHSLFGASKLSADVLCQEYGRYFQLRVGVFRGGCLTGSRHAGVELHGFLSYIVHCAVNGMPYTIYGYKGKQVRDQIHSSDVIQALEAFRNAPKPGEVYNLGGGFKNSASVLEIIDRLSESFGLRLNYKVVDDARKGDHICYYSDLTKLQNHFPKFRLKMSLDSILKEMVENASATRTLRAA